MNKKGITWGWEVIGKIILVLVVIVVLIIAIGMLAGEQGSMIDKLKDMLTFGA